MTVAKITITPHPQHPQWFYMTIESWKNSIGETQIVLLVTLDTLRMLRLNIDKTLEEQAK